MRRAAVIRRHSARPVKPNACISDVRHGRPSSTARWSPRKAHPIPLIENDTDHLQLAWENDAGTQSLTIGTLDPEAWGREMAQNNQWACWLDVSGSAFGLTADTTRRLARLFHAVQGSETVHRLPAASPHTDLALIVATGLGKVVLRVARNHDNAGGRADIPARDCLAIATMLDQLAG
ncbi:hypothetical protein ABZ897_53860 [Nonomuraea sp. NPDC046802]|uniref:hypothetical protein n=1 Tax=Nonomuraea sp. NPDC046802 TaxID=3154919 RepID=UPI0033E3286F